jgi:hypothetical protein
MCLIPIRSHGRKKEAKVMDKLVKYAAIQSKACEALTPGLRMHFVTEKEADMLG